MAKSIMIQGTMSDVGKSLLTAALCRIFHQDGYAAAPFKAQNMALNSYVTAEGLEMGRAQAMQAEAAGIPPSVRMNPILLKPTTDVGSQVIVHGEVRGNFSAAAYFRYKKSLLPEVLRDYRSLEREYDILVIEGAGSPVELNLKDGDIVNMGLAKLVNAPVLLVGDIDRGGVFPQLLGTLDLLEAEERRRVQGLIVNKFRGDPAVFRDGIAILEQKGGVPVVGVVPYVPLDLEDEDSLSPKLAQRTAAGHIDIAVIRLPRIANFTDFDVFSQFDGVSVRYVEKPAQLGQPDWIILPGTKSTMADLLWLRETGMEDAVKRCCSAGVPLFGICGGYQMLGETIRDPSGAEGGGSLPGMGLLRCQTTFSPKKVRSQVCGTFANPGGVFACLRGKPFSGYELHMGTTASGEAPLLSCGGGTSGNVYGCYVHGLFDDAAVCGGIVAALYRRKGWTYSGGSVSRRDFRETQFDLLADTVRRSLDLDAIYQILETGGNAGENVLDKAGFLCYNDSGLQKL